jgi:DNA invertase Pin-like site-specific DNA recombinase
MDIGYVRVSMTDQNYARQLDALKKVGIDPRVIYKEKVSGKVRERPELNRMLEGLQPGDTIIVAELSRLSRSTTDLFEIVTVIGTKGANIRSLKEPWLDTTTPHGRLLFTIFAGVAQFERELIADRTREGLEAAKARGRVGGRPNRRNAKADLVMMLLAAKKTVPEIIQATELSRTSVYRIIREGQEAE